jgi:hypothetical protein
MFAASNDGVYMSCGEVANFAGEKLELKEGKFRFWQRSDSCIEIDHGKLGNVPSVEGTYTVNDNVLTLHHPSLARDKRTFQTINGVTVLWRAYGLQKWTGEGKIHPFSALLKVEHVPDKKSDEPAYPTIKLIYSDEMLKLEEPAFRQKHPQICKACYEIVRANCRVGYRTDAEYKAMLPAARRELNAELINGLVELLGGVNDCPLTGHAETILKDLFRRTDDVPVDKTAQDRLINALEHARDRRALGIVIHQLLNVSKIDDIRLEFPQYGVQVCMTKNDDGLFSGMKSLDDSVRSPKRYNWSVEICSIAHGCLEWFRERLRVKPN